MISSVQLNAETYVVAGNQLGKDFVAAFIALSFFICPQMYFDPEYVKQVEARRKPGQPDWQVHTRRIVTTSVKEDHLRVLWGEIGRYLTTSEIPLLVDRGGVLNVVQREIRLKEEIGASGNPLNYLRGMVSEKGEGMAGHHASYTMLVGDECSGIDDAVYEQGQGWARRMLMFGNPNQCSNFFYKNVKAGDLLI